VSDAAIIRDALARAASEIEFREGRINNPILLSRYERSRQLSLLATTSSQATTTSASRPPDAD
jgi:hypothetical protein